MRATELGMAMHPGSDMPPAYLPYCALWPVSGLTSLDLPPSHDCSQWHIGKPTLIYRCGGSTGSTPVSRLTRLQANEHLKVRKS